MDIATVIGLLWSVAALMIGVGSNLSIFLDPISLFIVIGGTIAALLVSFPLPEVIKAPFGIGLRYAFFTPKAVRYALIASWGGKEGTSAEDLKKWGLGEKEETSAEDLKKLKKELELGILMYSRMKTYAQATGWIGVLIGLVIMLRNMDDPAAIGPGMAIGLLTALYGTIIAYLICLPIQTKLERQLNLLKES